MSAFKTDSDGNIVNWSDETRALFPCWLIFYRPKRAATRKQKSGVEVVGWRDTGGEVKHPIYQQKYKQYKRKSTNDANKFSIVTTLCLTADDYGTIKRTFKHKGYKELIGAFMPTAKEVFSAQYAIVKEHGKDKFVEKWRIEFHKHRSFSELYNQRCIDDPFLKQLCDSLEKYYPLTASVGQIKLL